MNHPVRTLDTRIQSLVSEWRRVGGARGDPADGKLSGSELDKVSAALLALQRGLTGDRGLVKKSYMDDPGLSGAYLLYYWMSSYCQVAGILSEITRLYGKIGFGSILDFGSGPGPAAAACVDYPYRDTRVPLTVTAFDKSAAALESARRLVFLPGEASNFRGVPWDAETDGFPLDDASPKPHLVIWSHSLNEIASGREGRIRDRVGFLKRCAETLSPDGLLVLQEPALLSTSRDLLAVRDGLLGSAPVRVVAPCFTDSPCPALAKGGSDTCHMDFRWTPPPLAQALAERAGLDRAELKSTYVAFARSDGTFPSRFGIRAKALESGWYRVVSESMLNKGGKRRFFVCGAEGRFTLSAKPELVQPAARAFLGLSRGDVVSFSGTEKRENGLGIVAGTDVAALPPGV